MKKIRVAALFSGTPSSLRYLFQHDHQYGETYEVACGISNKKDTEGELFCKEKDIPFREENTKRFCIEHGHTGKLWKMPPELRAEYYEKLLSVLEEYGPDLILLSGFMLAITKPLLGKYPIINVHPANLSILDANGKPRYIGHDPVTDAIARGETSTASTIHLVEEKVDCGRIICISKPLTVERNTTAKEHQEKMKMLCDGPAYKKALEMITSGAFVL